MISSLAIRTVISAPFAENTYIVWRPPSNQALIFDPGFDVEMTARVLVDEALVPAAIVNTHGHADHIAGNRELKRQFPDRPLVIGAGDAPMLSDPSLNLSALFGPSITSPEADRLLHEGDVIDYAGIRLEVFDVPGHSPGHVVFVHRAEPVIVFGGDVLFRESIGRVDFPGGNAGQLLSGIRTKLLALPADTVVYQGHGPVTTIGHEIDFNPFVGRRAVMSPD